MIRLQTRLQKSAMVALIAVMSLWLTACGETATPATTTNAAVAATTAAMTSAAATRPAVNLDQLIAAAKQEGSLTTIALPHDWCGYGDLLTTFKQKYGLQVNELNPDSSSGDEIEDQGQHPK